MSHAELLRSKMLSSFTVPHRITSHGTRTCVEHSCYGSPHGHVFLEMTPRDNDGWLQELEAVVQEGRNTILQEHQRQRKVSLCWALCMCAMGMQGRAEICVAGKMPDPSGTGGMILT
jgi:hypothetical protein